MPGAYQTVCTLHENDYALGLDSSTTINNIQLMLKGLGLSECFKSTASGDMVLDESRYGSKKKKSSRLSYSDVLRSRYV